MNLTPSNDSHYRTLRESYTVSRLIKGGWQLAGDHGEVERSRAISDMLAFYDAGITTFDCADIYTGVEEMLGQFRRELHQQRGEEALRTFRVHTKYVPDIASLATLKKADVVEIIDRSLQRLNTEQLDLVQFHWWDYSVPGFLQTVAILDELRVAGKIRHIGVTNFDVDHLQQLCSEVDIVSAQIQYSLLDQRARGEFAQVAARHNVHLLCYGVLAGGFLTDRWLEKSNPGFEFENRSLVKYRLIIEEFGGWDLFQSLLTTLRTIADKHSTDIEAVAIRCMLDNPDVSSVIAGARYAERLPKYLSAFTLQFDQSDKAAIEAITNQATGPGGEVFGLERDTSGDHGRIMKYNLNSGDTKQLRDNE